MSESPTKISGGRNVIVLFSPFDFRSKPDVEHEGIYLFVHLCIHLAVRMKFTRLREMNESTSVDNTVTVNHDQLYLVVL